MPDKPIKAKITAVALDDEPLALAILERYCTHAAYIDLQKTFSSAAEMLRYVHNFPVDLVFLDIQMPEASGTEICKKLPPHIMVVFTTAYGQYAVQGFDLNIVDFLLKPFSLERFKQTEEKVRLQYAQSKSDEGAGRLLYLRADYSLIKIPLDDVLYIEGLEDYIKFRFEHAPPVIVRFTMKDILNKLPEGLFVRVHRSFIVRIDKCERLRNGKLLVKEHEINVGRVYKKAVKEIFKGLDKASEN